MPRARIGDRHVIAAAREDEHGVGLRLLERGQQRPVGRGRAARDDRLVGDGVDLTVGARLAGEAVRGVDQDLSGRDLGHEAEIRDDHDRGGAQTVEHRLDEVDAGLLEIERDAPGVGLAKRRQHLAPRRDDLRRVEERHLREGRGADGPAKLYFLAVEPLAAAGAVLVAELGAHEHPDPVAPGGLPRGDALDPRLFFRHEGFRTAERVRVLQTGEERRRVLDPVHPEIQMADLHEAEVDGRGVARGEDLAARQRERRLARVVLGGGGERWQQKDRRHGDE